MLVENVLEVEDRTKFRAMSLAQAASHKYVFRFRFLPNSTGLAGSECMKAIGVRTPLITHRGQFYVSKQALNFNSKQPYY